MAKLATWTEGPASESRQGRKAREVGHPAIWAADVVQRARVDAPSAPAGKRQRAGHGPDRCRSRDGCRPTRLEEGWRWALRPCGLVAGHEPAAQLIGSDE
jgi:hypothetical protein